MINSDKSAYHGIIGKIVKSIEPHTEADPFAILLQLLAFVGNVVGRGPYYQVGADKHRGNIFVVIVGNTAKARKGSSLGYVNDIFNRIEPDYMNKCLHPSLGSGEGLIWAIRDPIYKSKKVKGKDGKNTGEYKSVLVDEGVKDKRAIIVEGEFGSILKVSRRDTSTVSPILRNSWDGKKLEMLTKHSPGVVTDPHVSFIGHITQAELLKLLNSVEISNGLANRILWAYVERVKELPQGGRYQECFDFRLVDELKDALNFAKNIGRVTFENKASDIWNKKYYFITNSPFGALGDVTARAEAQVIRLALIYAIVDKSNVIELDHLYAAYAVWDKCFESCKEIFGTSTGDPITDEIYDLLIESPEGVNRTTIRDNFHRKKHKAQIDRALNFLLKSKKAHVFKVPTTGRPKEVWVADENLEEYKSYQEYYDKYDISGDENEKKS